MGYCDLNVAAYGRPIPQALFGRRDFGDDFWLKIYNQGVNLALFPIALSAQVW
jgi:hypothetical protein